MTPDISHQADPWSCQPCPPRAVAAFALAALLLVAITGIGKVDQAGAATVATAQKQAAAATPAPFQSFVWARAGDALTLDPHAVNEAVTQTLSHQIYEPLIIRDPAGKLEPALATSWRQSYYTSRIWSFTLRQDVVFHGGEAFTADDVVFSLKRAQASTSDLRPRLRNIELARAVDDYTVEITTAAPDPLLPIRLTDIFIMSRSWSEKHDVTVPHSLMSAKRSYAATNANGTGPYVLASRIRNKETKLKRYPGYWGWQAKPDGAIEHIIYRPIADNTSRINALLEGNVDFVQDVPLDQLDVLRQAPGIRLNVGPENRVIFLGMSVRKQYDGAPNPLADIRLRKAINIGVDRRAIQRDIMLGQSIPTAVLAPPGIIGFPSELDEIPARDIERARALVRAASPDEDKRPALTLDCPTNRYVNDAAICAAIALQLGEIGIDVSTTLRTKSGHFKAVRDDRSQFYLLGWGVPTFDSSYIFANLYHSRTAELGLWNATGFTNTALDRRIERLDLITDPRERARSVSNIWLTATEAQIYVPIHVQTLMYATRAGVEIPVDVSNTPKLKYATATPREMGSSAN